MKRWGMSPLLLVLGLGVLVGGCSSAPHVEKEVHREKALAQVHAGGGISPFSAHEPHEASGH